MPTQETVRAALLSGPPYEALSRRLPEFEAETGCRVEVARQGSDDDLRAHLPAALAEPEPPYDLVSLDTRGLGDFGERLLPLDAALSLEEQADFFPAALAACQVDGSLRAVPRALHIPLLHYRSDLLEDASERRWFREDTGQPLRLPNTWEELAVVAQYFTRPGQVYGFPFGGEERALVGLFGEILAAYGGQLFDATGEPQFTSPLGEWAAALIRDLFRRWGVTPLESLDWGEGQVSEAFQRGEGALARDWPESFSVLRDSARSPVAGWLALAPPLAGLAGRRRAWTAVAAFAVPAASPRPELATRLARFLTDAASQRVDAETGAFPARRSAAAAYGEALRSGSLSELRWRLLNDAATTQLICPPAFAGYPEAEHRLGAALRTALLGHREPLDALRQARRDIEEGWTSLNV